MNRVVYTENISRVVLEKANHLRPIMVYLFVFMNSIILCATEIHVSKEGSDRNNGMLKNPVLNINRAFELVGPGDTITIHKGVYREWVDPKVGGTFDAPILLRAQPGDKVYIKGSEVVTGWVREKDGVWKVALSDDFFGDHNPFTTLVHGDWFQDLGRQHHTGDVYLNSVSLYELESLEKVYRTEEKMGWYTEYTDGVTTIWANFGGTNPNKELTELSVRPTCIYPTRPGIDYLTIQGFDVSQAATQWAAPTAEQVGMIATHWNKGWVIENNIVHDTKCSGITLGKDRSTGHNVWTADKENVNRDGNIHYIEVIFNVLRNEWDESNIGSHHIRNNEIYNCEQTAICGSFGSIFSTIENNYIHDIWSKRQFFGAELAAIKLHAPIDVTLRGNVIHDSGRGIWLDWMTQGARVTQNLLFQNDQEDLFIEVNHGPYIVDNNVFLSETSVENWSQGGAYVHNLFGGMFHIRPQQRFTPYFYEHSTRIKALAQISGGDDRLFGNLFVGSGTYVETDLRPYDRTVLPNWFQNNFYYNYAVPPKSDTGSVVLAAFDPELTLQEREGAFYITFRLDEKFFGRNMNMLGSDDFKASKIPKADFEAVDGASIRFEKDILDRKRSIEGVQPGPFSLSPKEGGRYEIRIVPMFLSNAN
jgi:hypothetical protein